MYHGCTCSWFSDVSLTGFATFKTKVRKGKTGKINGKEYTSVDKTVPYIKCGKSLLLAVANGK